MDSNEAANLAAIKSARLNFWLVIIGVATLVLMLWGQLRQSNPSQSPPSDQGGAVFMLKGWLPIIVLSISLVVSAIVQMVSNVRQRTAKRLLSQIASLSTGLASEKKESAKLPGLRQKITELTETTNTLATDLKSANSAIGEARKDEREAKRDAEEARREKLLAESNLRGVETDKNNYRTWYNELVWLNPAIKPQKDDVSNYIEVIAARPCLLDLKERVAVVDLVIRNNSFFEIAINPQVVGGRLAIKQGLLHDPAKALIDLIHPAVENLKPTKEATIAVRQPLLRSEREDIEDSISEGNDGRFWLGNLDIPISVRNAEPLQVDSKPLRINSSVEYVYFREFGGLTFDGKVITPQELVRDIDALPFPERLSIYQGMSKAYGASLGRLNEAKQREDPEEIANEAIKRNTNNT